MARTRMMASALGQSTVQAFRAIRPGSSSSWSSPRSAWSVAMTPYFLAEPVGELGGHGADLRGVDAALPLAGQVVLADDPARAAAEQDDPVAQPGRLPHVVGHEQHGQRPLGADPLQ